MRKYKDLVEKLVERLLEKETLLEDAVDEIVGEAKGAEVDSSTFVIPCEVAAQG